MKNIIPQQNIIKLIKKCTKKYSSKLEFIKEFNVHCGYINMNKWYQNYYYWDEIINL